ncbi:ribosome silencing factor [Roseivirga sp.]|uniref:ribosome silencing factor n=1 Tax=Roseivirga sp. TaxID=1964215 RepID=UPI003B8DE520
MNSEELSSIVVKGMEEKKAENIILMDLREVKGAVSDFFVICSGTSNTHIQSIAESIEVETKKTSKEAPWKKEGFSNREWVLIDYVSVVAHVFDKEKRNHYALEDLWGDAVITEMVNNS